MLVSTVSDLLYLAKRQDDGKSPNTEANGPRGQAMCYIYVVIEIQGDKWR